MSKRSESVPRMRAAHRHERMSISPRRFNWQRPWTLYSLLGFTLSLVVHALTYAGIDASRDMPLVWALHVGGMLAFLAMIIVDVVGSGGCASHREPDVTVRVAFRGTTPVFVNFLYPRPANDDLLGVLKQLASDRAKNPHH